VFDNSHSNSGLELKESGLAEAEIRPTIRDGRTDKNRIFAESLPPEVPGFTQTLHPIDGTVHFSHTFPFYSTEKILSSDSTANSLYN
jgi:hypothetical protein